MTGRIATAALRNIHAPSFNQSVRHKVLELCTLLLTPEWKSELRGVEDVAINMLKQCEEERDPRNLVLAFPIQHHVLSNYTLSEDQVTTCFENLASYFPIEFNPGKNDPHRITPEQLRDGL
eukprot:CAMPEP_0204336686 /NCGR_PEP_ID=MMETSP0469-20131031/19724_1 /ASSEMBLY_ACC=CAM_ASM_000384 /TAXON_ID=2969 /ORGANISM="Oxyrrhis marina" /LENGTH=120 /DNA_ID=CAMNT_0051320595 /DNA_START=40 /DNA_END=399 /DNA_ORIENTATION=+